MRKISYYSNIILLVSSKLFVMFICFCLSVCVTHPSQCELHRKLPCNLWINKRYINASIANVKSRRWQVLRNHVRLWEDMTIKSADFPYKKTTKQRITKSLLFEWAAATESLKVFWRAHFIKNASALVKLVFSEVHVGVVRSYETCPTRVELKHFYGLTKSFEINIT